MSSLMVISIANGGELLIAELTVVGSLTGVDSDVDLEVAPLVEALAAGLASEDVLRFLLDHFASHLVQLGDTIVLSLCSQLVQVGWAKLMYLVTVGTRLLGKHRV